MRRRAFRGVEIVGYIMLGAADALADGAAHVLHFAFNYGGADATRENPEPTWDTVE